MVDKILSCDVEMKLQFNNDIYSQFLCKFPEEINTVKNTLIYPATEKHLNKYAAQSTYLVTETPEIYQKVTLPFIQEQAEHLQVRSTVSDKNCFFLKTDMILVKCLSKTPYVWQFYAITTPDAHILPVLGDQLPWKCNCIISPMSGT